MKATTMKIDEMKQQIKYPNVLARFNEIKRSKIVKAINAFERDGDKIQGVGYGWINTHDYHNAEIALCIWGWDHVTGSEVRYELEEYFNPEIRAVPYRYMNMGV